MQCKNYLKYKIIVLRGFLHNYTGLLYMVI